MPTIPRIQELDASTVAVLNTIRENASDNYQALVPFLGDTPTVENIRSIGNVIMSHTALQNEFINTLVNRIGMVIITSKTYSNPLAMFKRGIMDIGETVEEIFVQMAKPYVFDQEGAETTLYKRYIPDVKTAFHTLNAKHFYPTTVSNAMLRQAFVSLQGVTDLISRIIEALYTALNADEFLLMKYMLGRHMLKGYMKPVEIATPQIENIKSIVSSIKATSNEMTFINPDYNLAQVDNFVLKEDQFVLVNSRFDAVMDVEVLASAFNMDKAQFAGKRVLVDSFGKLSDARLALLFAEDPNYIPLTSAEKNALDSIPAIIISKDFFMIFDYLLQMRDAENAKGLYWNYFLHTWKILSISPFAPNALFVEGTPAVVSVTVSPATASLSIGSQLQLTAVVDVEAFAPKTVLWTIDSLLSTVDSSGKVTIGASETASSVTVTATSTFDDTKSDSAVITVLE
jgi:hypothetical protein